MSRGSHLPAYFCYHSRMARMVRNRRDCIRCALLGVPLEPSPHGETLDVSETGIAWVSPRPMVPGELVYIESPALFDALQLPWGRIQARVRSLAQYEHGQWRIGAVFVAPSDRMAIALRKAVLKLQRHGAELDSHVVDVLVLPHL